MHFFHMMTLWDIITSNTHPVFGINQDFVEVFWVFVMYVCLKYFEKRIICKMLIFQTHVKE